ncbi:YfcZ/YiiS family protein [Rodentibacter pneumotropicus]|uniref:Protein of uncharacterized function (DUF406) n=1 Tax=Rodentibacter pneumotropicus TaxID=758 RepID=A0A448MK98_9PAST|nr:YfcZ/YiiS family protein [Rodentibacter pneumotropicus]NBH75391.1 DUF406 family protein [Rodentibacter pneumotropicus]OOF65329.1 hypothetical protein BH925_00320 [Rodentibacter pneumotropicus]THA03009.1 DUF406 family protein [Rodentibacter pneumotropicus]THA06172.1 DUF406 family protein [Rodentibacter pneumotropicus]THA13833.1 DUF406 family protein [Rodentibacter pneumotropicus]
MAIQTERPVECVGCNTFDMKSLFDNRDCTQEINYIYDTQEQAQTALDFFTQKAREVESEPCEIQAEISKVDDGYLLKAKFAFCCQAELVIFQMKTA